MKKLSATIVITIFLFLAISGYASDTITIASWNIRNFGESKANNDAKMAVIAKALSRFDIIAVQEISNVYEQSDAGCPRNESKCPGHRNCNLIANSLKTHLSQQTNKAYEFMFSPQVKDERYLFVYDKNKIEVLDPGKLVKDDGDDADSPICDSKAAGNMVRQPFYATFKAGIFDFTLVPAHTSPSRNVAELQALNSYYQKIQATDAGQNDVILLGDLNAGCNYLRQKASIDLKKPEYTWVIGNGEDTTVSSTECAYDRMIFTQATAEDYTGKSGVFRFDKEFNLSKTAALGISDHFPIWAQFYTDKDTDHHGP